MSVYGQVFSQSRRGDRPVPRRVRCVRRRSRSVSSRVIIPKPGLRRRSHHTSPRIRGRRPPHVRRRPPPRPAHCARRARRARIQHRPLCRRSARCRYHAAEAIRIALDVERGDKPPLRVPLQPASGEVCKLEEVASAITFVRPGSHPHGSENQIELIPLTNQIRGRVAGLTLSCCIG